MFSTRTRRALSGLVAASLAGLALSACSSTGSTSSGTSTVSFAIWSDPVVSKAYEKSFAEFEKKNPGVKVQLQQIPWANYWTKLQSGLAAGSGPDIFWTNAYYFAPYADEGDLVDVGKKLSSEVPDWQQTAVTQYTRKGELWGVPQLVDGGKVLYYNKDLVEKAGVDVSDLSWNPDDPSKDTFLKAVEKLTIDKNGKTADEAGFDPEHISQYGFNSAYDFDDIIGNFVGSNGGKYQDDGKYTFASDQKAAEAIKYTVDLINKYHVAPSASDTNTNGDYALGAFTSGKLAVFEGGSNSLATIAAAKGLNWAAAEIPAGPAGTIPVTNSIIAAGNAKAKNQAAIEKVLAWVGSADGSKALGASGGLIPAVTAAQQSYLDYWKSQGFDASIITNGTKSGVLDNPIVPNAAAASADLSTAFQAIYLGQGGSFDSALTAAQKKANAELSAGD
jgi:multiple sugar transport system substrate-binding protein